MEFAVDAANPGGSSLQLDRKARGRKILTCVPARRLSALVSGAGLARIDALKIAIEGAEDRASIPFLAKAPSHLWPRAIPRRSLSSGIPEAGRPIWRRICRPAGTGSYRMRHQVAGSLFATTHPCHEPRTDLRSLSDFRERCPEHRSSPRMEDTANNFLPKSMTKM